MALSKKEWMAMQNEWLKEIDPRLYVSESDPRITTKFAIAYNTDRGTQAILTEFLTRQEWFVMRHTINICGEDAFRKGLQKRMI